MKTTDIKIDFVSGSSHELRLEIGACKLIVTPDDGNDWVVGTYTDPTDNLPMIISDNNSVVTISQERNFSGFVGLLSGTPTFNLKLGKGKPYSFTINGGASECDIDLGGLPITSVSIAHGAAKTDLNFSAKNPVDMTKLTVSGGATATAMTNLSNASVSEIRIEGGASSYKLDFGGSFTKDAKVSISTGMSSVDATIPKGLSVKLQPEATMGSVNIPDGFTKKEGVFLNESALSGKTPLLWIQSSVTMGSINVRYS